MLVREVMHPDPLSIRAQTTLQQAYALMQKRRIRHLPVLGPDARVIGIVTDRDLRLATSALVERPWNPEAGVQEVMKSPVITADPLDPIESAARTMRQEKIGCLPVVDETGLVGIVTGVDLLDAMLQMTGVHKPSGRLEVLLPDRPGELSRLTGLLSERRVNIQSILSYPDPENGVRLVLRVAALDTRPLADAICETGIDVVWPPHRSCR